MLALCNAAALCGTKLQTAPQIGFPNLQTIAKIKSGRRNTKKEQLNEDLMRQWVRKSYFKMAGASPEIIVMVEAEGKGRDWRQSWSLQRVSIRHDYKVYVEEHLNRETREEKSSTLPPNFKKKPDHLNPSSSTRTFQGVILSRHLPTRGPGCFPFPSRAGRAKQSKRSQAAFSCGCGYVSLQIFLSWKYFKAK